MNILRQKTAGIESDVVIPDFNNLNELENDWSQLYPGAKEELPDDMLKPKGRPVRIIFYFDSNYAYDLLDRKSMSGIILFLNSTPVKWYSKRQGTVESSTYSAELVTGRVATNFVVEYR